MVKALAPSRQHNSSGSGLIVVVNGLCSPTPNNEKKRKKKWVALTPRTRFPGLLSFLTKCSWFLLSASSNPESLVRRPLWWSKKKEDPEIVFVRQRHPFFLSFFFVVGCWRHNPFTTTMRLLPLLLCCLLGAKAFTIQQCPTRRSLVTMQLTRGDARGAALLVEDVSVFRGPSQILTNVNWRVEPTARWGLVGANGSGKTTLLKTLVGEVDCADGKVIVSNTAQVGYLQQTAVAGSNRTIYQEAASAMKSVEEARAALEKAQELVQEDPSDANLERLDAATERYEAVGGYTQEQTVASVLKGLGFQNMDQRCDELSGGWQMRVALARLLLSSPKVLILDEPSNHLDVNARKWLANYLANYDAGALVLVTHDVALLNSVTHIAELAGGTLHTYKSCTYDQYLEEKQQRAEAALAEYERQEKKAAKLQGFVDRFGASATKASAAQSRVKQLEKMQARGLLDAPEIQQRFKPTVKLPDPPRAIGETLLSLQEAQVGWTSDCPLVSNIDLTITKGMKLLLRGPNGAGKSTCLAALRGTLELMQGTRTENPQLRYAHDCVNPLCLELSELSHICIRLCSLGVFTQDLAQELDPNARAVDLVVTHAREGGDILVTEQDARSVMGRLGLSGEKPLRKVGDLSGGEKARVALSMFCIKANNAVLLDEPSNHLDTECIEALSQALSDWGKDDGAVVVVSHDKAFCQDIGFTHVGTVQDGTFVLEERSLREGDWSMFETDKDNRSYNGSSAAGPNGEQNRKLQKQAYNAPKRIQKLERMIEKAETQVAELEEEMVANGSNMEILMGLTAKKQVLDDQIASYMEEWEELETLLGTIAQ